MAMKATIYKASLQIADMDRHYYAQHNLTLACHPSETEERLMLRLLAFALHASDSLQFTRGLSSENEPDLWDKDSTGTITHWIEIGMPDESRIRKACGRARRVSIYCYGARTAQPWWEKNRQKLARFENLSVFFLSKEVTDAMALLATRNMDLHLFMQDGQATVSNNTSSITVLPETWQSPS